MRKLLSAALVALVVAPAMADPISEQFVSNVSLIRELPYGISHNFGGAEATPGALYSNIDTFTATIANQGPVGAGAAPATGITRMLMEDIHLANVAPVTSNVISLGNGNTVAVAARVRVRFWAANGAGGGPGTFLNLYSSTNNLACNANTICLFNFALPLNLPQDFWAGIAYDNGGTGVSGTGTIATSAQLANIGQGTWNPPAVGTSQDRDWLSTASDSTGFNGISNPAGAIRLAPLAPVVANYGWEFLPEPGTIGLLAFGALGLIRRKR